VRGAVSGVGWVGASGAARCEGGLPVKLLSVRLYLVGALLRRQRFSITNWVYRAIAPFVQGVLPTRWPVRSQAHGP
jgi:hypothetical protein